MTSDDTKKTGILMNTHCTPVRCSGNLKGKGQGRSQLNIRTSTYCQRKMTNENKRSISEKNLYVGAHFS